MGFSSKKIGIFLFFATYSDA